MVWKVTYYNEQVVERLQDWPNKMQAKYLRIVDLIEEHGPLINGASIKSFGDGLFEIRVRAQEGISRAFFCYSVGYEVVLLHTFVKKT